MVEVCSIGPDKFDIQCKFIHLFGVLQELPVASWCKHDPRHYEDEQAGGDECGGQRNPLEIGANAVLNHVEKASVWLTVRIGV